MIPLWMALIGVTLLLVLALFLAIIDVAFDYFSKISIRTYREESWKTDFLTRSLEDPMSFLLPLRIGIQGAFTAIAVLVTMLYLSLNTPQPLLMAFTTILLIFLVFREIFPNIIGRRKPERLLLNLLPTYRLYAKLVNPISRPLSKFVHWFVVKEDEQVTHEEVQAFIETGEEEGILEGDEGKMVHSIVDLGDKVIREVMTPRPEVVAISCDATVFDARELFTQKKYSRVPVYRGDLDSIEGLIYAIDLVAFSEADPKVAIKPIIHDVFFVPESKKVLSLLEEFQKSNQTIAIVVDEYGGTSGLVTVEDIVEEIVGEIHDEYDHVSQEIVEEKKGVFLVSGRADIDDVQEHMNLPMKQKGYETVSGYILDVIGRIPQVGEVIEHSGLRIEIVEADGQKINTVRMHSSSGHR